MRLASSPSIGFTWVADQQLRFLQQLPSLKFEASSVITETEGFETLVFKATEVGSIGLRLTDQHVFQFTNEPYYLFSASVYITEP